MQIPIWCDFDRVPACGCRSGPIKGLVNHMTIGLAENRQRIFCPDTPTMVGTAAKIVCTGADD